MGVISFVKQRYFEYSLWTGIYLLNGVEAACFSTCVLFALTPALCRTSALPLESVGGYAFASNCMLSRADSVVLLIGGISAYYLQPYVSQIVHAIQEKV